MQIMLLCVLAHNVKVLYRFSGANPEFWDRRFEIAQGRSI